MLAIVLAFLFATGLKAFAGYSDLIRFLEANPIIIFLYVLAWAILMFDREDFKIVKWYGAAGVAIGAVLPLIFGFIGWAGYLILVAPELLTTIVSDTLIPRSTARR
jgi:hypothetical protein